MLKKSCRIHHRPRRRLRISLFLGLVLVFLLIFFALPDPPTQPKLSQLPVFSWLTGETEPASSPQTPGEGAPGDIGPEADRNVRLFPTGLGDMEVREDRQEHDWGLEERTTYLLPNGDRFCQVRLTFGRRAEGEVSLDAITLPEQTALYRFDRQDQSWFSSELGRGELACGQFHVRSAAGSMLLVAPQSYIQRDNQMLEHLPELDGYLRSRPISDGWRVEFCVPAVPDTQAEYFYLASQEELVDWDDAAARISWASYDLTGVNRWCYNGYYYRTPDTYVPSGENYFHLLPAAHIAVRCTEHDYRGCFDLALVMLHVMLELQNDQGYFPTLAESTWLSHDYGIPAGFYDTRFNSDLVKALLTMNRRYNIPEFADAAIRYGQFYQSMAERCHFTVDSYAWLVWDYYVPGMDTPTHCSLNHQAAEILVLYQLYDLTNFEDYRQLAEFMVKGILALGDAWILENGDLAYAYLPNGDMGMTDYPYLTYNDLFDLREALDRRYGEHDPQLDRLMESKRQWMDARKITGYKLTADERDE